MTPFEPCVPYSVAAAAPRTTSMWSMSAGLMSIMRLMPGPPMLMPRSSALLTFTPSM